MAAELDRGLDILLSGPMAAPASPDGRLLTVNSKVTVSMRASGIGHDGDLRRPRIAKGQNTLDYTSVRGALPSPIEGRRVGVAKRVSGLLRHSLSIMS